MVLVRDGNQGTLFSQDMFLFTSAVNKVFFKRNNHCWVTFAQHGSQSQTFNVPTLILT